MALEMVYEEKIKNALDDIELLLGKPVSYLHFLERNKDKLFNICIQNNMKEDGFSQLPRQEVQEILSQDREYFEGLLQRAIKLHKAIQTDLNLEFKMEPPNKPNLDDMIKIFERCYEILSVEVLGNLEGGTMFSEDPNIENMVSMISEKISVLVENMLEFTAYFEQYIDPQYS